MLLKKGAIKLDKAGNLSSPIKQLMTGRIDLLSTTDTNAEIELQRLRLEAVSMTKVMTLNEYKPYMALSRKTSKPVLQKLKAAYTALVKEGRIEDYGR